MSQQTETQMCRTPVKIQGKYQGEDTVVQCRKCEDCIAARKRHWIGRMLAEEQTCHSVWFATLTYAGGYGNTDAYWINYTHAQRFFKRLRKTGHKFKYVAVGEHGTEGERAHFHIMIFWQNEPPEVTMDENFQWEYWPHGHSYLELPRSKQGCAVYIMDYLNKDNLKRAVMKYSKNPMLGHEYLVKHAEEYVTNGLSLFAESDRFTIPNNPSQSGKPFYYPVGRDTAMYRDMMDAYLNKWAYERPDQPLPLNEDLTEYLEGICQDTSELSLPLQQFIARHYGYEPEKTLPPMDRETTFSFENFNVILRAPIVRFEAYNTEGTILWQSNGIALPESQDAFPSDAKLKALLVAGLKLAPPRTRPFVEHLTSELSMTFLDPPPPPSVRNDQKNYRTFTKYSDPQQKHLFKRKV